MRLLASTIESFLHDECAFQRVDTAELHIMLFQSVVLYIGIQYDFNSSLLNLSKKNTYKELFFIL